MYTAEQLRLPPRLELAEVIREANRLLKLSPALADSGEFSERTIYYYVQKRILPRRAGRGPGTTYPPGFVYRLLFIRLLQKAGLSLDDIQRDYLHGTANEVPDETIKNVLLGELPMPAAENMQFSRDSFDEPWDHTPSRMRIAAASRRDSMLRERRKMSAGEEQPLPSMSKPMPRTKVCEDRIPASFEMLEEPDDEQPVRRYPLGESAELLVHRELTPSQERRLEHLARLLSDILDEPD